MHDTRNARLQFLLYVVGHAKGHCPSRRRPAGHQGKKRRPYKSFRLRPLSPPATPNPWTAAISAHSRIPPLAAVVDIPSSPARIATELAFRADSRDDSRAKEVVVGERIALAVNPAIETDHFIAATIGVDRWRLRVRCRSHQDIQTVATYSNVKEGCS